MATYNAFDVVVVPFPFIEASQTKKRPAVILSCAKQFNLEASAYVMAMITSAAHTPWPCDLEISDLISAGLPVKSIMRMKLFTIDQRLIQRQLGTLSKKDQFNLKSILKKLLPQN